MLKDIEVGVTMERRRQSAVYSPGGCGCGLLLLPVIAVSIGVMFALAGLAAAALVCALMWALRLRGVGDAAPYKWGVTIFL